MLAPAWIDTSTAVAVVGSVPATVDDWPEMARFAAAKPAGENIALRLTTGDFGPHQHAARIVS
jgi:hypothetical protein